MPRRAEWSRDAVREVAARQLGLITSAQLMALGVPRSTV
ncbi:MAG: type IV toxin-antitoxin system AbiEi family antitoxin domain-containing protein, partial [Candidatus Nanopelagicales bacterium]